MQVDEHTTSMLVTLLSEQTVAVDMKLCIGERFVEFSFCYRKYVNRHHFQIVSGVDHFVSETIDVQVCKEQIFWVLVSDSIDPFYMLNFIVIAR